MCCEMLSLWDTEHQLRQWFSQMTCSIQTHLCMRQLGTLRASVLCECRAVSLKEDCLKDVAKRGQKEECLRRLWTDLCNFFLHCNVYRTVCSHLRMFISRRKKNAIYLFLFYDLPAFNIFFFLEMYLCACSYWRLSAKFQLSWVCVYIFFPQGRCYSVWHSTFQCIGCCTTVFG